VKHIKIILLGYITRYPHDKATCNRRMSSVHSKHDGSLR